MWIVPSSSISIWQPVASTIPLMTLPCGPMTAPIFLGVDVDGGDARRVLGEFGAVGLDRFLHLVEDQAARFAGLIKCLPG